MQATGGQHNGHAFCYCVFVALSYAMFMCVLACLALQAHAFLYVIPAVVHRHVAYVSRRRVGWVSFSWPLRMVRGVVHLRSLVPVGFVVHLWIANCYS